jgi:hypothetical protein
VRDSLGRILPQATSVQVWRTRDNKILSFDVLAGGLNVEGGRRRGDDGGGDGGGGAAGYNKLAEEDSPVIQSNFNSREESHKDKDIKGKGGKTAPADETAGDSGGGGSKSVVNTIMVRGRARSPPSKLTILEELNPGVSPLLVRNNSRIYRVLDDLDSLGGGSSNLRLLTLDQWLDRRDRLAAGSRLGGSRVEIIKLGRGDRQLNYSRHYGNQGESSGTAQIVEVDPSSPKSRFRRNGERYIYHQRDRDHHGAPGDHFDRGDGRYRDNGDNVGYHEGHRHRHVSDRYGDDRARRHRHRHGRSLSGDGRDRRRDRSIEERHPVQVTAKNIQTVIEGKLTNVVFMSPKDITKLMLDGRVHLFVCHHWSYPQNKYTKKPRQPPSLPYWIQ